MRRRLTFKQRVLVATTLFGMFFGAGNLIFPVYLGQLAGRNAAPAMLGFIVAAVGIPILGVAAIGNTRSDGLQALASRVGRGYGYAFTCLLYLTIGPFFAIPRCATTSFTTGILPLLGGVQEGPALLVFSLLFFAVVLALSLRPANITVWIGKVINPLFLLFLAILLAAALSRPSAVISAVEPAQAYADGALFAGFIEGYGTMDAIAGLAFGIVVIDIIRSMGVADDADVAREVLASGLLTGLLMAGIYVAAIVMGAQSRGFLEIQENGGAALAKISGHYLGAAGSAVLALTITFACLKTSIGLVTSCAEAFERMFPKGPAYKAWAVGFTAFSFAVSNIGLSGIIEYSLPVLMFLYPPAITLILLALCGGLFEHDRAVYACVTGLTCAAALFDLIGKLPSGVIGRLRLEGAIALAQRFLPLYSLNLGWVLPALAGLALGLAVRAARRRR